MAKTPTDKRRDRRRRGISPEIADRYSEGLPSAEDDRLTNRWRRGATYPGWLPRSRAVMGDDTAAILSQLPAPSQWRSVKIRPRRNADGFTMRVELKRGLPARTVILPSRENVTEVTELLNGAARGQIGNAADRARLKRYWRTGRGNPYKIAVDVIGTDRVNAAEAPLPAVKTRKNLPPRQAAKKPAKKAGKKAGKAPAKAAKKTTKKPAKKPIKKVAKKRTAKKAPPFAGLDVARLVDSAVKVATKSLERENAALRRQLAAQGKQLERIERLLEKLTEG